MTYKTNILLTIEHRKYSKCLNWDILWFHDKFFILKLMAGKVSGTKTAGELIRLTGNMSVTWVGIKRVS